MSVHKTACILCSRNCGIEVEIEDGHLRRIRGDSEHPISQGYLCQKAARLDHYQNHDDRLATPLKRGPRGELEPVSWDQALSEIAMKLQALRGQHGGHAFAFYGGGGQGNHLGAAYGTAMLKAMDSPYLYNALGQEKTGDFWVNGRLFGRQSCHLTEDVEHAQAVLFIGTNPWQAHGIRNARQVLKELSKNPDRFMAVIDPRRTETAALAHEHIQLKPGTDAFLLSAMLALIVREGLVDQKFIDARTVGYEQVRQALERVPIASYVERAGVSLAQVERVVRRFVGAQSACVRIDLGLQQSLHSTLNSYLEKLLFLLTGNFGRRGGNNFHSWFTPLMGHSPEGERNRRTRITGAPAIAEIYPPNVLPAEIDSESDERVRALFVDSSNPVMSAADSPAYERAFAKLELLVVVDVSMTETARLAHYVLPAASQFEKWEATGFTLDFPRNGFHLRAPLFEPRGDALPEAEIYTRLLETMGELPARYPVLEAAAKLHRRAPRSNLFWLAALGALALRPRLRRYGPHVLYRTLGRALPPGAAATAPYWFVARRYAAKHGAAVRRAGHQGKGGALGEALFEQIMASRSGVLISEHRYEDTWAFMRHADGKVHLAIAELLEALDGLRTEPEATADFPLVLIAGERRAYNANTILRDPAWRKNDSEGALAIHPEDAARLGLEDGDVALCASAYGEVEVTVVRSEVLRRGVVSLPHGFGLRYRGGQASGPAINKLTGSAHRDGISGVPFHKNVPVRLALRRRRAEGGPETRDGA